MGLKHSDRCLDRVHDDEPIFVLRAQDKLAPLIVEFWAAMAEMHACGEEKVEEARFCAQRMKQWQDEHGGGKFPD